MQELPRFNALLRSGQIDERRAMAVVHAMSEYLSSDDPRWALIEERVARRAPERTAFELRGDVLRAVKAVDPALEDQKAAKAKRRCFVSTFPLPDGLAGVEAVLSAEAAAALDTALTAMADAARDAMARQGIRDDRNHQERRAAALGRRSCRSWTAFRCRCIQPCPLRLAPAQRGPHQKAPHQETPGKETPRRLARRSLVLLRPAAVPVSARRETRRQVAGLQGLFVRLTGCSRSASQCDVDHIISDADGGPTCACNLAPLCPARHLIKTFGGWEVYRVQPGTEGLGDEPGEGLGEEPGSLVWISPLGRRYVVPLPDLPGSAHW